MKRVLYVIDAQEDFTRGTLRNEEAIRALPIVRRVVDYAIKNDMDIFYTKDTHDVDYLDTEEGKNLPVKHCIRCTPGWSICPEVIDQQYTYNHIVYKDTFGAMELLNNDDEADEIWICGFCTDICVSANFHILKTMYPNTPIYVIEDACAGVTPELHEAALKVLESCHAHIVECDELIS